MNAHDAAVAAMADILQIPLSGFSLLWRDGTYTQRSNGTFTSIEENLAYICRHLKVSPASSASSKQLMYAMSLRGERLLRNLASSNC